MGVRHQGNRPTWRRWPARVIPIALLAGGVLAGTPAAIVAVAPAAASTSVSSHFAYACGASFTPGEARCLVIKNTTAVPTALTVRPGVIPANNGYGPSDLQSAYGLTSASGADGAGATVAVVDAFDDPTAASDLAAYRSAAGLPALTSGQFTEYNQDGQTSPLPAKSPAAPDDWTQEVSLDVDMVSAICPHCKIDLIEADDDHAANLLLAELTAAALGVKYISNSWGFSELAADTTLDNSPIFGMPGVVYVAGAGESGFGGGMVYPAASPNVVSVGGTTLHTSSANSRGWTESVWDTPNSSGSGVTGSGCSAFEPQPSWQTSISTIPPACSKRVDNDVAADADPSTGAAVYDTSNGNNGWFEAGGTSEATPIIAAVFALADNNGNSGNNAADSIYTHTSNLNEVTAGSNGTCTPPAADSVLCTATGAADTYNGPTGWGTPNGITAFNSDSTISNTVTVTGPAKQSGNIGTAVSLQVSATDSAAGQRLGYVVTGLPAGLSMSATGLISGKPTTAGTRQVTVTVVDATGASATTSFTWTISSTAGKGPSPSPSPTCSSPTAPASSPSATSTTSPSPSPSGTPSPTPTSSPSPTPTPTSSPSPSSSGTPSPTSSNSTSAHLTSLVSAASKCSASATPSPSASASPMAAAPTPSAVSGDLAVTG